MKRAWTLVIGAGLFACGAASSAFAADLAMPPPPPPAPAAVPVLPPVYNWSGFFVGGHLGYGWGSDAITPDSHYPSGTIVPTIAADPRGIVAGVQYGTNWQFDRIVLGTESDFSFTDIRRSQTIVTSGASNTGEQKLPWFGTTRVRAGYTLQDNLLIYATGGLANGTAKGSFSAIGSSAGAVGSRSKTLWGWTVGGGLEYGMGPWSAKIEYLHYDIGTLTFYTIDTSIPGGLIKASTKFDGDMVRVGVDYRFAWTPWQLIFGR